MSQAGAPAEEARAALETARDLLRQGRPQDAEFAYARVLQMDSNSAEALGVLGYAAFQRNQLKRSTSLLERACALSPGDSMNRMYLGLSYDAAGRGDDALMALRQATAGRPEYPPARLHLGLLLARNGQEYEGLCQLLRAIVDAQSRGAWLSPATTPPSLREPVATAIRFVAQRQRELFELALGSVYARHGRDGMARVADCLSVYLKDLAPSYGDARQAPRFLFFPGLPTTPYFDRSLFPWLEELESRTAAIRDELLAAMPQASAREQVFHNAELAGANLRNDRGGPPVWDGIYLYRHGERKEENCMRCPRTALAIDAVSSLVRISGHAPEVMLSMLTPGTHILPHRGVTNTRLVAHLPLIVPGNCALRVGGELHEWREGRGVVFDDTFEHEAWNRGEQMRAVLILDIWNPHLTEAERDAVTVLIGAIADFRQDWQKN